MHRDKKIGFALGILLVGIVAAFFFRNEPDPFAELPPLDDPASLDAQIAENPIAPYAPEVNSRTSEDPVVSSPRNPWELPEIYHPVKPPAHPSEGLPVSPGAPAPINLLEPVPDPTANVNRAIEVGSPFGASDSVKPFPANEPPLPENEGWTSIPEKPSPPLKPSPARQVPPTQPPVERPASTEVSYKIQQGDTLSVLAEKHLGSSRRYMEIYEANRDKLKNPDDIKIGMVIRIPPRVKFTGETSPPENIAPENAAPETKPRDPRPFTRDLPPPESSNRFMPFSRSPLAPPHH